ncbi:hypothetical protein FOZ62_004367, partial [Perkinsus olseni]
MTAPPSVVSSGDGRGGDSQHMVPDAGLLACLLGVPRDDLLYCSDQDLELVLSRFSVEEKPVGERVALRKLLVQIRGKALGGDPRGEGARTFTSGDTASTATAQIPAAPPGGDGGQIGRPRAQSRLSNLLTEISDAGSMPCPGGVARAMQGIAQIPIPGNAEYQGDSDARPITSWIREMTLTSRVYELNPSDIWRLLLRALSPTCRTKLLGHLERAGCISAPVEERLQEAERFMLSSYRVTDDPVRFRSRLSAVTHRQGECITSYTSRFSTVVEEGQSLGLSSTSEEALDLYRKNLTPKYQGLANTLYCGCNDVESLSSSLARWELVNLPSVVGVKALDTILPSAAGVKSTIAEDPGDFLAALGQARDFQRSKRFCWECKDPSHLRRDCPVYKKRLAEEAAAKRPEVGSTV